MKTSACGLGNCQKASVMFKGSTLDAEIVLEIRRPDLVSEERFRIFGVFYDPDRQYLENFGRFYSTQEFEGI